MSFQDRSVEKINAVFLDLDSINKNDLKLDALSGINALWKMYPQTSDEQVEERLVDASVIVTNKVNIQRHHMQQASNLRLICVAATGTNNVDLESAREFGIVVCNVNAYATASVVQYVFASMLSLSARLSEHHQSAVGGSWSQSPFFCLLDYPFHELAGKKLGIVGYGELGRAVASVAKAFGMEVLIAKRDASDNRQERIALSEMLPAIDVLSLHCPLTEQTRNLITATELALMPKGALLINSARGGIVNEADLLLSLQQDHLGGAAIDVLSKEPPEKNHPLLSANIPNLIVTPHIAWASVESRQRLIEQVALNISEFLQGRERNRV